MNHQKHYAPAVVEWNNFYCIYKDFINYLNYLKQPFCFYSVGSQLWIYQNSYTHTTLTGNCLLVIMLKTFMKMSAWVHVLMYYNAATLNYLLVSYCPSPVHRRLMWCFKSMLSVQKPNWRRQQQPNICILATIPVKCFSIINDDIIIYYGQGNGWF